MYPEEEAVNIGATVNMCICRMGMGFNDIGTLLWPLLEPLCTRFITSFARSSYGVSW